MRQKKMNVLTKLVVRLTESKRSEAGQTMTEYVLIIAAIAVAGYIAYQGLEVGINGLISKVTGSLSAA
jgi:Flp pilus assembly pilin Flp